MDKTNKESVRKENSRKTIENLFCDKRIRIHKKYFSSIFKSLITHRRLSEHPSILSSDENMKFYLYKHRNDAHVKVPLATPEIIEFNESIATPFSVKQHNHGAFVLANHKTDETFAINSSSSSPPTTHQHHGTHSQTTRDESITDSSKQTRGNEKQSSFLINK